MKIETNFDLLEIRECYNSIRFITNDNETLYICMRDSGYEIFYGDKKFQLVDGHINILLSVVSEKDLSVIDEKPIRIF